MLDWGRKQIENLEIDIKSTTKITDKNMVKLVLQKKQIRISKSHKFASNTKNTVVNHQKFSGKGDFMFFVTLS